MQQQQQQKDDHIYAMMLSDDAQHSNQSLATYKVLVKEVENQCGDTVIWPSSMNKQQSGQKSELSNRIVTCIYCLHSLLRKSYQMISWTPVKIAPIFATIRDLVTHEQQTNSQEIRDPPRHWFQFQHGQLESLRHRWHHHQLPRWWLPCFSKLNKKKKKLAIDAPQPDSQLIFTTHQSKPHQFESNATQTNQMQPKRTICNPNKSVPWPDQQLMLFVVVLNERTPPLGIVGAWWYWQRAWGFLCHPCRLSTTTNDHLHLDQKQPKIK